MLLLSCCLLRGCMLQARWASRSGSAACHSQPRPAQIRWRHSMHVAASSVRHLLEATEDKSNHYYWRLSASSCVLQDCCHCSC